MLVLILKNAKGHHFLDQVFNVALSIPMRDSEKYYESGADLTNYLPFDGYRSACDSLKQSSHVT
jgi:hypothetical protein